MHPNHHTCDQWAGYQGALLQGVFIAVCGAYLTTIAISLLRDCLRRPEFGFREYCVAFPPTVLAVILGYILTALVIYDGRKCHVEQGKWICEDQVRGWASWPVWIPVAVLPQAAIVAIVDRWQMRNVAREEGQAEKEDRKIVKNAPVEYGTIPLEQGAVRGKSVLRF